MESNNVVVTITVVVIIIVVIAIIAYIADRTHGTHITRNIYHIIRPGHHHNRPHKIGGCAGTRWGCCPDGKTAKANHRGTNC